MSMPNCVDPRKAGFEHPAIAVEVFLKSSELEILLDPTIIHRFDIEICFLHLDFKPGLCILEQTEYGTFSSVNHHTNG